MHARVKKLNPHANTPAVVKMNEINPKYENTQKIHRLLTNQKTNRNTTTVPDEGNISKHI
jgi:hypothetical protein